MDKSKAHQHFSVTCFNETWSLLDNKNRPPEQTRLMIAQCHASLYHWLSREDKTPQNLSVGLWQVARVYAVVDSAVESMRFGLDCLEVSQSNDLPPFYVAYGHEAVCRAAMISGDSALAREHLEKSSECAKQVSDPEDQKLIEADIAELTERVGNL